MFVQTRGHVGTDIVLVWEGRTQDVGDIHQYRMAGGRKEVEVEKSNATQWKIKRQRKREKDAGQEKINSNSMRKRRCRRSEKSICSDRLFRYPRSLSFINGTFGRQRKKKKRNQTQKIQETEKGKKKKEEEGNDIEKSKRIAARWKRVDISTVSVAIYRDSLFSLRYA